MRLRIERARVVHPVDGGDGQYRLTPSEDLEGHWTNKHEEDLDPEHFLLDDPDGRLLCLEILRQIFLIDQALLNLLFH